jgi:hypothetical protein
MEISNEIKIDLVKTRAKSFWSKVKHLDDEDACWTWQSYRSSDGYGHFTVGRYERNDRNTNIKVRAHQAAFILSFGYLPAVVRHLCDNPPCCNPKHLIAGNHASNVADRVSRNRSAIAEKNGRAKLSVEQVLYIKKNPEKSAEALARECGVTRRAISLIRSGKNWRSVS